MRPSPLPGCFEQSNDTCNKMHTLLFIGMYFYFQPGHSPTNLTNSIDPFHIRRTTSIPLRKGTDFTLHRVKMSTTKRRTIQVLHISKFQFTFKCGYNYLISKYTDINSLHVTQIDLLHNDTFCST